MSIRAIQQNRLMVGVAAILSLALLVTLLVATTSARAESHEHEEHDEHGDVTLQSLIGNEVGEGGPTGNAFLDDLQIQYRLTFGEADSGELGMRRTHVINVHDADTLRMMRLDFPPGTGSPWHTHPQPLVIGVAEGEITVTWSADCEPRTYRAGDALIDFGLPITAVNNSDETAVLYVMVLGIPDGVPFMEAQDENFDPCANPAVIKY
jgi:quercetin dioxygenase-like cupin family protein